MTDDNGLIEAGVHWRAFKASFLNRYGAWPTDGIDAMQALNRLLPNSCGPKEPTDISRIEHLNHENAELGKMARQAVLGAEVLSDQCEELRVALRYSERAMSAMLTGVSVHNGLNPDAGARKENIEGEVVNMLADARALAFKALNPTSKESGDA